MVCLVDFQMIIKSCVDLPVLTLRVFGLRGEML